MSANEWLQWVAIVLLALWAWVQHARFEHRKERAGSWGSLIEQKVVILEQARRMDDAAPMMKGSEMSRRFDMVNERIIGLADALGYEWRPQIATPRHAWVKKPRGVKS